MQRFVTAAVCAAGFLAALPASAATLQVVSGTRGFTLSSFDPIGQSFTAVDQNITSFGLQFQQLNAGANDPVTWTLYAGETLAGIALATRTITVPTSVNGRTPTWVDFDVTGTTLAVGQKYSFALTTGASPRVAVTFGPDYNYATSSFGPDAYAGGRMLVGASGDPDSTNFCTGPATRCDINFRVTGSTPVAAVPEPAAWATFIAGFGLLGGAARRRRFSRFAA